MPFSSLSFWVNATSRERFNELNKAAEEMSLDQENIDSFLLFSFYRYSLNCKGMLQAVYISFFVEVGALLAQSQNCL